MPVDQTQLREKFNSKDWAAFRVLHLQECWLSPPNFHSVSAGLNSQVVAYLDGNQLCWAKAHRYFDLQDSPVGKPDPKAMVENQIFYVLDLYLLDGLIQ